jgi:hypothetical protein
LEDRFDLCDLAFGGVAGDGLFDPEGAVVDGLDPEGAVVEGADVDGVVGEGAVVGGEADVVEDASPAVSIGAADAIPLMPNVRAVPTRPPTASFRICLIAAPSE